MSNDIDIGIMKFSISQYWIELNQWVRVKLTFFEYYFSFLPFFIWIFYIKTFFWLHCLIIVISFRNIISSMTCLHKKIHLIFFILHSENFKCFYNSNYNILTVKLIQWHDALWLFHAMAWTFEYWINSSQDQI